MTAFYLFIFQKSSVIKKWIFVPLEEKKQNFKWFTITQLIKSKILNWFFDFPTSWPQQHLCLFIFCSSKGSFVERKETVKISAVYYYNVIENSTKIQRQEIRCSPVLHGLKLINQEAGLSPHFLSSNSTVSCV